MKTVISCFLSFLFYLAFFNFVQAQDIEKQNNKTEYSIYKNRVSINLLGVPSANLVASYERAFKNQAIWIGYNHHLNGLFKDENRNLSSIAAEYRYYFFAKKSYKLSNGLFAGIYSKYRTGEETKNVIISTTESKEYSHSYDAVFAGLNLGYRYNYKHLALSVFTGYGFLLSSSEINNSEVFDLNGENIKLNEGYKNDLRLGITVGFSF